MSVACSDDDSGNVWCDRNRMEHRSCRAAPSIPLARSTVTGVTPQDAATQCAQIPGTVGAGRYRHHDADADA